MDTAAIRAAEIERVVPPHEAAKARVEWLADFLDTKYRIPGLGYRFGWDSILGLIPGIGDAVAGLMSVYLIWGARRAGARCHAIGSLSRDPPAPWRLQVQTKYKFRRTLFCVLARLSFQEAGDLILKIV